VVDYQLQIVFFIFSFLPSVFSTVTISAVAIHISSITLSALFIDCTSAFSFYEREAVKRRPKQHWHNPLHLWHCCVCGRYVSHALYVRSKNVLRDSRECWAICLVFPLEQFTTGHKNRIPSCLLSSYCATVNGSKYVWSGWGISGQ